MPRKSHLPHHVRRFIVESLARLDTPKTVADAVKKEFGVEISRQAVEAHDPSKVAGVNLASSLREHFHKTRETFRRELDAIPVASKAVRLWFIDKLVRKFEERGNLIACAQMLEQAAKEMGGMYVGRGAIPEAKKEPEVLEPRLPPQSRIDEMAGRYVRGLKVIEGRAESDGD